MERSFHLIYCIYYLFICKFHSKFVEISNSSELISNFRCVFINLQFHVFIEIFKLFIVLYIYIFCLISFTVNDQIGGRLLRKWLPKNCEEVESVELNFPSNQTDSVSFLGKLKSLKGDKVWCFCWSIEQMMEHNWLMLSYEISKYNVYDHMFYSSHFLWFL